MSVYIKGHKGESISAFTSADDKHVVVAITEGKEMAMIWLTPAKVDELIRGIAAIRIQIDQNR